MTLTAKRFVGPRFVRVGLLFVATAAILYFAAMLWAGWGQTVSAIATMGGSFLVGVAILSSTAYVWRFGRWEYALRRFAYRIPRGFNFRVYISGLALTTSPGKVGETLRSVLLAPRGVRMSHSLGAFLADRLSDVLGVCLLGIVAALVGGKGWPSLLTLVFVAVFAVSCLSAYALVHPAAGRFWQWFAMRLHWLPVRGGQSALESWAALWSPARALFFALIAVAAYGTQAWVFALLCVRGGAAIDTADAVAVFVNATLFGAASMVPGGLGAMEASVVFQLVGSGVAEPTAVSLAIASRLVTLWTGVGLGVVALATLSSPGKMMSPASSAFGG